MPPRCHCRVDQPVPVGVAASTSRCRREWPGNPAGAGGRDLAVQGVTVEEAIRLLTAKDVRWAADVFRP
ncbi:hypothetical protein, partial [Actinoplanes philippinensis]|uniref:hypothetical protein n=1 Tax=Actinoplanes philippinensis TaxID=35752 RepID=UPI00340386FA